jgi:CRISPR-associated protein Csx16
MWQPQALQMQRAAVCSQGARYFNLSLDLPADWRGRELSAYELRQCQARLECFEIQMIPASFAEALP